MKKKIAGRLKIIQADRRLKDFAERCDENPRTMSNYLAGERFPSFELLEKLHELGVNLNWFITGSGDTYINKGLDKALPSEIQQLLYELNNDTEIARLITELARGMIKAKRDITQKSKK